jgi:hypothetical protein
MGMAVTRGRRRRESMVSECVRCLVFGGFGFGFGSVVESERCRECLWWIAGEQKHLISSSYVDETPPGSCCFLFWPTMIAVLKLKLLRFNGDLLLSS